MGYPIAFFRTAEERWAFHSEGACGMARKNYMSDYRVTERVDERGRVHKDIEYAGPLFRYAGEPSAVDRERRFALILCAVGAAAFIAALVPRSAASGTFYITLPFVFAALPLGLVFATVLSAPKGDKTLERKQAERLQNRYPAAAMFVILLCAVSLTGEGIFGLRGGVYSAGDAVFSLCAAISGACGGLLFHKRRSFDTRKA